MRQSITLSLSQTIWPRLASRQFLTLLIVQILLPVTFAYSLSSEAVVMTTEEMKEAVTKDIDTLTQEDFLYIIENGKNIEKSPGELRKIAVTQSPVKDHWLTLMWKNTEYIYIYIYIYIYMYVVHLIGFQTFLYRH